LGCKFEGGSPKPMAATAFGAVVEARRQGAQERSAGKTMPWIGRAKPGRKDRAPLKASQGKVEVRTRVLDVFVLTQCGRVRSDTVCQTEYNRRGNRDV
jgi:hypothetical protein